MYNEQIEKLIELALADGVITEQERQVLFKKAKEYGIDFDEFEMALNARLFEKEKNIKENERATSDKFGDIRKCPACGVEVLDYQIKCENGHYFYNIKGNKHIQELVRKLESVSISESKRNNDNSLKSFLYNNSAFGLQEKENKKKELDEKKAQIISNFPIPKTKNDIMDFIFFIAPKMKIGSSSSIIRNAWVSKFDGLKSIGNTLIGDSSFFKLINELEEQYHPKNASFISKLGGTFSNIPKTTRNALFSFVVLGGMLGIMLPVIFSLDKAEKDKFIIEQERLENINSEIDSLLLIGETERAEIMINRLHWQMFDSKRNDHKDVDEKIKSWDEIRQEKKSLIEKYESKNKGK